MRAKIRSTLCAIGLAFSVTACADFEEVKNDRAIAAYSAGDYQAAYDIWSVLAETGNPRAQNNMGVLYTSGQAVERDVPTAIEWFRKSAEQGYALAMGNLGDTFFRGDGVPQDYEEAARWYELGAVSGDNESQFFMGRILNEGLGRPQDPERAYVWFSIAADNGYEKAVDARDELALKLSATQLESANAILLECNASDLLEC